MPKIPPSHILEAKAVQRVQAILSDSSALSEVVKNDYGEDLIVQTHHLGQADPFQILIQVKGISRIDYKSGSFTFRFEVGHLYRWVSQLGAVLVCVYDDMTKRVFAFSPSERFSQWDVLTTKNKSLAVQFDDTDEFNLDSAKIIIWKTRIQHFSNMLAIAESKVHYLGIHDDSDERKFHLNREMTILSLSFLKLIGAVVGDEFNPNFRKIVRNGAPYFVQEWDDPDLCLRHVVMFALVGEVNEATGCGVPSNILEHVCETAGHFYRSFHRDEWEEAERNMPRVWRPFQGFEDRT